MLISFIWNKVQFGYNFSSNCLTCPCLIIFYLQTEFKRIMSPLKYQTRCVAAFPDKQGFLVWTIITFFFYYFQVFIFHLYLAELLNM